MEECARALECGFITTASVIIGHPTVMNIQSWWDWNFRVQQRTRQHFQISIQNSVEAQMRRDEDEVRTG